MSRTLYAITVLALMNASAPSTAANASSDAPVEQATAPSAQNAPSTEGSALETIIVTAQKRSENLQDVPISVTAITAQSIEDSHVVNLQALSGAVPDVQINHFSNTPTSAVFAIRGMSVIDPDPYAGQTVTVVMDGVPLLFNMISLPTLFDIDRVEVLKGPQGTLFGANTIGGVVNIVTGQPTGDFGGKAEGSIGNYNRVDGNVAFNFPVSDTIAGKVTLMHHSEDGYVTNIVDGESMGNQNDTAGRVYLKWTPNDTFNATLIQEVDQLRDGGPIVVAGDVPGDVEYVPAGTQVAGSALPMYQSPCLPAGQPCRAPSTYYSASSGVPDQEYVDMYATTLTMNYASAIGDLVSITGYRRFNDNNFTDQDGTPVFQDATHRITDGYQLTEEARDSFKPAPGVQMLVGSFLSYDHYIQTQNYLIQFAAPGFSQINTQNESSRTENLFVQTYVDLTDKLQFQGGLRGTSETTEMTAGIANLVNPTGVAEFTGGVPVAGGFVANGERTWNNVGGKTGFDYKWSEDVMTYAYYARGFKSGGYVGRVSLPTDIGPYNPEYVDTLELGLKGDWLDHRLRTNIALFYNKYHDLQLAEIYFLKNSIGVTVNGNTIVNAAQAKTQGVEFELQAAATEAWKFNMAMAYLYAKYTDFPYKDPNLGGTTVNRDGYDLQDAPPFSATFGTNYTFNMGGAKTVLGILDRYTDKFYDYNLDDTPRSTIRPTNYVDGTLDYTPDSKRWSVGLWVRNIANIHALSSVFEAPGTLGLASYAPPREFGATIRYNW